MSDDRPVRFDDRHRLDVSHEVLDGEVAREDAQRAAGRPGDGSHELGIARNLGIADPTVTNDALAAPFAAPIRKSSGLRRPIDDYDWSTGRAAPIQLEAHGGAVSFEIDPCPRWMTEATYRGLMSELRLAVDMQGSAFAPTRRQRWTLRHIWRVTQPPVLESSAGAYDMIGVAFALMREAKRRGRLEELGAPTRRRLG